MSRLSLATEETSNGTETPLNDPRAARRLSDLLLEVARCVNQDVAAAVPSRLGEDPRLSALRNVLLEDDRAAFAAVQQKLDDPEQFAEAVSAVLPKAFARAEARNELNAALGPVERAFRNAIRKDPSILVGVLYPVVGPAIRKSIAENLDGTLRRLNQAFKHSFSWRGLKWRIEALRTGSSFADVVLKHTAVFRVEHIFLIHRKSGLLLGHVAASDAEAQDPHMVSGMLTAIQDFVRDSFSQAKGSGGSGIDSLRLGDLLLWCEEGPYAFLAALIRGNPPDSLHAVLRETLATIHADLDVVLQDFEGDSAALGDLAKRVEVCLQQHEQVPEKHVSPWLWAIPLVLLLGTGFWIVSRTVEGYRVDNYVERLRDQPGVVVTDAERRDGQWHISGLRDPLSVDPASLMAESNLDPSRVVGHWEPYQALNPAIMVKRLTASLGALPSVSFTLDGTTIRAQGSAPQHWVDKAQTLIAALPAGSPSIDLTGVNDVQDPTFIRLRDAIQAHIVKFDSNDPKPARGEEAVLDMVTAEFRELGDVAGGLGFSVRMTIVGHADATGTETANLALTNARAEVVRSMLLSRGIASHLLFVRSAGTLEPQQTGPVGQELAINRRVTFTITTSD